MPPDNRCCFCLTLKKGALIIAICSFITGFLHFAWYITTDEIESGWNLSRYSDEDDERTEISKMDVAVLTLFFISEASDLSLAMAIFYNLPFFVLPWLSVNVIIITIKMMAILMLLFYGSQRTTMTAEAYTATLAILGILTALRIFCFLIIYQFRKNMVEEIQGRLAVEATAVAIEASAPIYTDENVSGPDDTEDGPKRPARSPPPSYEEVFNNDKAREVTSKEFKIASCSGTEPPIYSDAVNIYSKLS